MLVVIKPTAEAVLQYRGLRLHPGLTIALSIPSLSWALNHSSSAEGMRCKPPDFRRTLDLRIYPIYHFLGCTSWLEGSQLTTFKSIGDITKSLFLTLTICPLSLVREHRLKRAYCVVLNPHCAYWRRCFRSRQSIRCWLRLVSCL
jgi:hypothetical protein